MTPPAALSRAVAQFSVHDHACRAAGATVVAVEGAEAALAALDARPYTALVSDIAMAGLDGYELIRKVRGRGGPGPPLPAIAVSAYARGEDAARARSAGYQAHMAKPVDPGELVREVARLVRPVEAA
jgi:CheY-like chemotaxis protein